MPKEIKINYFLFIAVFFGGIVLTLALPDFDQNFKSSLGHRSIITHSILFPYLIYHFYLRKKDEPNVYLVLFIIAFYISIAIHLSADLHPKGWRGTALIKLPGNSSIGEGPSIIWMFLNIIVGTYFSSKLFISIANTKKYFITYLVLGSLSAMMYAVGDGGDEGAKFITFVSIFLITFFVAKKKSGTKAVEQKKVPLKKTKKKEKKTGKSTGIIIFIVVATLFGGLIFLINNTETNNKKNTQKKQKITNWRADKVYKDEFNICKYRITQKYSNKNFSEFKYESFNAAKNQKSYTKTIKMWMKHDGLILKNKKFGYVDCYIKVNPDQSINFIRVGDKYK